MTDILIRNIPDEVADSLTQRAANQGIDRMSLIREKIIEWSQGPIVHERYAYRFYGPDGAYGVCKRVSDHVNGISGTSNGLNGEQADAVRRAKDLMRRNNPGDQLKAYDLLKANFEEVFEVSV
jgi:hypothetical protein